MWCVDPIDGTRDFVRGRPGWAVSVALVLDGAPVLGVLYAPARDELWVAERGRGAQRNGLDLTASQRASFSGARVPADALPRIDSDLVMVAKPNSIALRIAMVAADEADLVATLRWGFEWDVAAAALIASEAGASVSDAFGAPLVFNTPRAQAFGVIACAAPIHSAVVDQLAERAAEIAPRT
jgi:myo-inositol-1(or 4)-monophosphatase